MKIFKEIENLCKVRNEDNHIGFTKRLEFIVNLLEKYGLNFHIDKYYSDRFDRPFYNVELLGSSNKVVVAHHDIINIKSDNANDNSASVINAIATKILNPDTNVVILDGEEPPYMGVGSKRCSDRILGGEYGDVDYVLNLELTGKGGKNFIVGKHKGKLYDLIISKFDCSPFSTPFSDSVIFQEHNIDSTVITSLPLAKEGEKDYYITETLSGKKLNWSMLNNCHSINDSLETICHEDMEVFVKEVVLEILKY